MTQLVVLGSGQDGGSPQLGRPQQHEGPHRTASSLALMAPSGVVVFDASPDIRHQFTALAALHGTTADVPQPSAIFLTHAHMGHYTGLVHLGREGADAQGIPTWGSQRMGDFLRNNEPWSSLLRNGNLRFTAVADGDSVAPLPDVAVRSLEVPHRPDLTDNLGFVLSANEGVTVLYLPDIDRWDEWAAAGDVMASVDVAMIDGTFFSGDELPGRPMSDVPHPPIVDTIERFRHLTATTRIILTHLNHTNPAGDPETVAAKRVREAGFEIATDGMTIDV